MGRWFDAYAFRVGAPGERRVALLFTDVTAVKVAERERERLVAALQAERDQLRQAFDQAPGFVAVLRGPAHRYEYVNGPYTQIAGHRPLLGRTVREAFPELAGQGFYELLDGVYATGEPFTGTALPVQLQPVPGGPVESRRIDLIYQPLTEPGEAGADGAAGAPRVTGLLVQGRDVTDAAAAREAADLAHRRLEAVLDQLPVGVHIAEAPGGRLVLGNAAVRRIWGAAPASAGVADYSADYVATHYDGPRAGQVIARDAWPLARALATGEVVEGEVVDVVRGDGSRVLVSLSAAPVRDADGAVVGGVVTSTDVTERERLLAAERLAVGRARLLQALSAAFSAALTPEAVVRVLLEHGVPAFGAATGLVLLTSADGTQLKLAGAHGYPAGFEARFAGLPLDAALPIAAAVREQRAVYVEDAEAGVRAYPDLAAVYAATGAGATAALPLTDGAGRTVGALAFNFAGQRRFDAAERASKEAVARQCAQALERARLFTAEQAARSAAEHANAAKGQFLATMSHELRTPLNAIGGYAELMELGIRGPVTEAQRADLARIQASQRHLLGLVNEVLDLAKVDAGAVRVDRAAVRAGDTVDAALALVRPQAAAKGLALEDACGGASVAAYVGDEPRVRQILVNLLSNAVKFTPAGGRVVVACALDEVTPVGAPPHGFPAPGPYLALRVTDTGVGIAPGDRERIFEPFTQAGAGTGPGSNPYTRAVGGTGLGLTISRRFARLMGGDLTVEGAPGGGSTFTLWLPAVERRAAGRSATPARGRPAVRLDAAVPPRADDAVPAGDVAGATDAVATDAVATDAAAADARTAGAVARIGQALVAEVAAVMRAWVARLRADPAIPDGPAPGTSHTDVELEDHAATLVTGVAVALRALADAGAPGDAAGILRDGTAILGVVAERHGSHRARLGWAEAAVTREFALLAAVLDAAAGRVAGADAGPAVEPGLARARADIRHLLAQAERGSLGGFRLAAPAGGPAGEPGPTPAPGPAADRA
jgi:signal transduction histidine kinase/PAS domain-containing protein